MCLQCAASCAPQRGTIPDTSRRGSPPAERPITHSPPPDARREAMQRLMKRRGLVSGGVRGLAPAAAGWTVRGLLDSGVATEERINRANNGDLSRRSRRSVVYSPGRSGGASRTVGGRGYTCVEGAQGKQARCNWTTSAAAWMPGGACGSGCAGSSVCTCKWSGRDCIGAWVSSLGLSIPPSRVRCPYLYSVASSGRRAIYR